MRHRAAIAVATVFGIGMLVVVPARAANHEGAAYALDAVQPELKFANVTLAECLNFLRDTTDANIVVDWRALESVNVNKDTLVNLRLRSVTLRKALDTILSEAGAGNLLTFYAEENVLTITTRAKADSILFTKVYPVKDLLVEIPNVSPNNQASLFGVGGLGATSGGGSSASTGADASRTIQERGGELVKLIQDTIRPEIWRENGGPASIRFFHGNLIITAPLSVLEAIGGT